MNKGIIIAFVFLLSGCEHLHERSLKQDWDSARTLEQKRDLLLMKSDPEKEVSNNLGPKNTLDARRDYLLIGKEDSDFLNGLVSSCTLFTAKSCVYHYYARATKKIIETNQNAYVRSHQNPVKKGDLFYCKVKLDLAKGIVDSTDVRVGVKDEIDSVGFVFSNGYQIISPKLKIVDTITGERQGMTPAGTMVVNASYDGSNYLIRLFDNHLDSEPNKDAVRYVIELGSAGSIAMYDCKDA